MVSFKGNPQHAVAAAGGLLALIASAPAWAIGLGAAAVIGGAAYLAGKADDDKKKK